MKKTTLLKKTSFVSFLLTIAVLIASLPGVTVFAGGVTTIEIENTHYGSYLDSSVYTSALGITDSQYQSLKQKIADGVLNQESSVNVSEYKIKVSDSMISVLSGLIYKNDPRFFNIQRLSIDYNDRTSILDNLLFEYAYSKSVYRSMLSRCEAVMEELTAGMKGSSPSVSSDVEKALLLHDRLAVLCEYDLTYSREHAYDIYGVLVENIAVCEGYAQAYNYLLDNVGIESYMVSSDTLNHAWNIVKINGKKYHVDVTWDDPTYDTTGRVKHDNFLLSSNGIYNSGSQGHKANDYDTSPTDTTFDNYFWQDSNTEFCYLNGSIYYIDNGDQTLNRYKNGVSTTLLSVADIWYSSSGGYWIGNYSRLSVGKYYLYVSLSDGIYRYDEAENKLTPCYKPDLSAYNRFSVYGFKADETYFYLDVFNSPNFNSGTKALYGIKYAYSEPEPPVTVIIGDVSGDGEVDSADAGLLLKYDAGSLDFTDAQSAAADVSADGEADSSDASLILKYDAGSISVFPANA